MPEVLVTEIVSSLFIFLFFSYPPKKMITAIQVYKKDPETGKMYMWRYID